jgi:1A family penicillin-binding protein
MALLKKKRKLRQSYSVAETGSLLGKQFIKIRSFQDAKNWVQENKKFLVKLGLVSMGVFTFCIIALFAYVAKDLPSSGSIEKRKLAESTKIYDRSGQHILYQVHGEEKRTVVPLDQIPMSVQQATIALEDQAFYRHFGIHPKAILRALFKDIIALDTRQGASTITQQFVKNSLLTNEQTFSRKIREAILAIELEALYSKDEILTLYLNEIPYGSNAYGIEAASQTFFNKSSRDLSLDEAALLAALPRGTTLYSPYSSNTERLVGRKNYALDQMAELGYIKEEEALAAKNIDTLKKVSTQKDAIAAAHFVMYVREFLSQKYGDESLEQSGYKVYTTLDWDMQQKAEEAVRKGAENNTRWNAKNAALVAIDPPTGEILAMVGSKDYFNKEIDGQVNVATRERQPGSSFKPYVYLNAFTKGYFPETVVYDVETEFDGGDGAYSPQNYNGSFSGPVALKKALGGSLNVPAVKVLYLSGVKSSVDLAKNLGIGSVNDPKRVGLSLVLGGGEVTLLDHTHAYSTIANGGVRYDKVSILKIEDASGNVVEEHKKSDGKRVVEEKYVNMLSSVLSNNENRSWVFGSNSPLNFGNGKVAAKTGTTNEFRDGWTVGYSTGIAVGVWAGNNDNSPMKNGADGANVAAPLWRDFINYALSKTNSQSFPSYDSKEALKDINKPLLNGEIEKEEEIEVCEIPGKDNEYCLANDNCSKKQSKKRTFINPHDILYYVNKDNPQGPRPDKPSSDSQYKAWEKGVEKFYQDKEKTILAEPPTEKCKAEDFSSNS